MSDTEEEVILNGRKLRTVVRAAETPIVGAGVKKRLFTQLGLDELFELDLRSLMEPEPIVSLQPPSPIREEGEDE